MPGRIILASFIAIVLAEAADTEIYQRLLQHSWLARVAASNAVSIPLDTLLFSTIAFAGVPDAPSLAQIVVGDLIFKGAISMAFALWKTRANSPPPARYYRYVLYHRPATPPNRLHRGLG